MKVEMEEVGAYPVATALVRVVPTIGPLLEGDMPWPMKQRVPIIIASRRRNKPPRARLKWKGAAT
jgi:hypothetical protein